MLDTDILEKLAAHITGDVAVDSETIRTYSTDASLFKVTPDAVVFPKDTADVEALVSFVNTHKKTHPSLSLTARSAGTDMSGGSVNDSIIVGFERFFTNFSISDHQATVEPGVFYRDFEKEAHARGLLLPSYPASKSIAALGGMIANNAAGEKTLRYGSTSAYVRSLTAVLSDGNTYTFSPLSAEELEQKKKQQDFEGEIYRSVHTLLSENAELIEQARPSTSKNVAGYALWDIWDGETFDLTKLFSGAQGTLGIMTKADIALVDEKPHTRLAVLFLDSVDVLPELVNDILPLEPEGLEIFDDETLKLALRFFPSIAKKVEGESLLSFAWKFIPEALIGIRMRGLPKIVVLAQFAEDTEEAVEEKFSQLKTQLKKTHPSVPTRFLRTEAEAEKYWVMRRESFSLLRKSVSGRRTAPFIEDLIVAPAALPEVLPKVHAVLSEYGIKETIAGHAGSGNFHIIPLMDLTKKSERDKIPVVSEKIYDIVLSYGGSITAEHNDGLIRTPYLEKMYGAKVDALFADIKNIFDPQGIFNPRKKVNGDIGYAMDHIHQME